MEGSADVSMVKPIFNEAFLVSTLVSLSLNALTNSSGEGTRIKGKVTGEEPDTMVSSSSFSIFRRKDLVGDGTRRGKSQEERRVVKKVSYSGQLSPDN